MDRNSLDYGHQAFLPGSSQVPSLVGLTARQGCPIDAMTPISVGVAIAARWLHSDTGGATWIRIA
jgi:hypothetical protein